jgi:hypothetical protein
MPVLWTLKKWLAVEHDIYRPTELRRQILERTGIDLSHPALSDLLRRPPKSLKVSTMEALCTAFGANLSDFCQIAPGKPRPGRPRKLYAAHGKRAAKATVPSFPSPADFNLPVDNRPRKP